MATTLAELKAKLASLNIGDICFLPSLPKVEHWVNPVGSIAAKADGFGSDCDTGKSVERVQMNILKARGSILLKSPQHKFRNWMKGRCYHKRIQKKWDKRWVENTTAVELQVRTIRLQPALLKRIAEFGKPSGKPKLLYRGKKVRVHLSGF